MIQAGSAKLGLSLLMGVFVMFGISFAHETRLFRAPDERMHWHYITEIGDGRLPVVTNEAVTHLAHQPPLYYFIMQPGYQLIRNQPLEIQVRTVRIISLLIASLVIPFVWVFTRVLVPNWPWAAWLAAASVALNPQFIFISSVINNDALTNVLAAEITLVTILIILRPAFSRRRMIWIGGLAAAAVLTKVILWPLVMVLMGVTVWKLGRGWRQIGWALFPLGMVALWWGWRNNVLYQDPTAYRLLIERWGEEQGRDWLHLRGVYHWLNTLIESFWARFGYFNLGLTKPYYQTVKAIGLLAGLGLGALLVTTWHTMQKPMRQAWIATWAIGLIVLAGVFIYSLNFYQPQGRYLFAAMGPIMVSLAAGLTHLVPAKKHWVLVAVVVIGLWTLDWASWQVIARRG